MGYFIAIMCGLAYRWVKIDTDDSSRKAGINVALLFVAAQCACKAYGGFISFFVFTALSVMSFYKLPGVAERLKDGPCDHKKKSELKKLE